MSAAPRTDITAERLRELLDYDPETGIFTWKKPASNRCKAGDVAGAVNSLGYIYLTLDWVKYRAHRMAWLYVYGEHCDLEVDHINGIRSDNRIANLRKATRAQNMLNQTILNPNTKSGVTGVKETGSGFSASVSFGTKKINLGVFQSLEAAIDAYKTVRELVISHLSSRPT